MYNIVFTFDNGMMLTNWSGLRLDLSPINGYNVNWDTYTLPNGSGSAVSSFSISGVDRTVKGVIWSDDPETLSKQLNDVFYAFTENSKGSVILPAYLPSGTTVAEGTVKSDFIVKKTPEFVKHSSNKVVFLTQIYCLSPYWRNESFTIKDIYPESKVQYNGSAPTFIQKIIFTSSTVEGIVPGILNDTTGEAVSFSEDITIPINGNVAVTFSAGDFKAMLYDGEEVSDITSKMTDFSQPIRLIPGENSFLMKAGNAQLQYNDQYSGVSLVYGN